MDKAKKQDILIRICCVIASFILWFYIRNIENPVTNNVIKYVPVELMNTDVLAQHDLVLLPQQELTISITVKGPATVVYQIDRNKDFKLVADLSKYALKAGQNTIPVQVKEAPSNVTVVNSENLWVKINLDNLKQKQVNVVADIKGSVANGFYYENPIISPTTVVVSGAEKFVDTVTEAVATIDLNNEDKDIVKTVDIIPVNEEGNKVENVNMSVNDVSLKIPLKKVKSVPVEVKTEGSLPKGTLDSIQVNPSKVEITGRNVDTSNLTAITTEPIDLSKITESTSLNVKLNIPEGLRVSTDTVTVKINVTVENKPITTEKKFDIPINYVNAPNNSNVTLGANAVQVVLSGEENKFKDFDSGTITATLDLNGLPEGATDVPLTLNGIPNYLTKVSQSLDKVKVTIKLNNTEENKDNVDKNQ